MGGTWPMGEQWRADRTAETAVTQALPPTSMLLIRVWSCNSAQWHLTTGSTNERLVALGRRHGYNCGCGALARSACPDASPSRPFPLHLAPISRPSSLKLAAGAVR